MKDEKQHGHKDSRGFNPSANPPIISITLSALFGILPGIGFALSIYISLAVVTLIARAVRILG